jgi:hypothetical protein
VGDDLVVGDGPRLAWSAAPHRRAAELVKLA